MLLLGHALTPNPAQAQPWISSPSASRQGDTTQVNGGGFAAGESVVLKVVSPSGFENLQTVDADQNGAISSPLVLDESGSHTAEAWNVGAVNQGDPLAFSVTVAAPADAQ